MKKSNKNKFSKTMFIPLVISIVIFILYKNADSKLEQLLIVSIYVIYIIPFTLHLFSMLFLGLANKPKSKGDNSNSNVDIQDVIKVNKTVQDKPKYKTKEINNTYYLELRDRLVEVIKQGYLKRKDILRIKLEIDKILDINKYHYDNFIFDNDVHEIYIKLKNSKFTDDDYIYLKGLVEDLVG